MGLAGGEVGDLAGLVIVWRFNLDGFNCEGLRGVLGEHRDDDVVYYLGFCFVRGCYVDEDIAGFKADFGVVGIDYWRHRADCSVCIEDDGVDWGIFDYV